jgi:hypothetical protein
MEEDVAQAFPVGVITNKTQGPGLVSHHRCIISHPTDQTRSFQSTITYTPELSISCQLPHSPPVWNSTTAAHEALKQSEGFRMRLGFPTRHLGPVKMTTGTALGVTKRVALDRGSSVLSLKPFLLAASLTLIVLGAQEGLIPLEDIPWYVVLSMLTQTSSHTIGGITPRSDSTCESVESHFVRHIVYGVW